MLSSLCLLLLVIATGETMGDSPTANKHRSLQNPPPPPPDNCNTNQDEVIRSDFLVTLFGSPEKLTENEATFIETAIADTYNKLIIAEASCPQGFRNVSTIELRTNLNDFAGAREDLGDRQFDLDFRLVGYCQHCPNAATLFARENQTTAEDGDCACEPPLSDRYVVALQDAVDELRSNRQLRSVLDVVDAAELVPVECELELTNFTTSVLVEFVGASMVTEEDQTLLAAAFSQTYNRINGVNTETCDKYFRQVIAVSASLDTDLGRRRQLLMYDHNGYDNHDNHNHDDSFDVRGRRLDEEDPEVSIRFDILASCRGCNASNTKLFEEESSVAELSRRRLHEIDLDSLDSFMDLMEHTDIRRVLQEDQPPPPPPPPPSPDNPKECRCAENAEDRAISEPEFVTAFNETIAYFTDAAVTVEEAIEIEPFECSSEVTTFNTTTSITITATNVTDAVIQEAGNQFRISYNTLSQRFCDPFFRTIDTVVPIMERRVLSHSRRLTTLVVRYTSSGVCRLCPDETTLFDDATNRRRRRRRRLGLEGEVGVYNGRSGRFLQDTSCFCAAVNVVQGAPTEREFFQRYSDDVQQRRAKGRLEGLESIDSVLEDTTGNRVSTSGDQCTTKQDCTDQNLGTLCVANQCLRRGNPRFTLTWTGDDDLDLKVTTPLGVEIGPNNEYDPMSRGLFNTRFVQTTFRDHVESIYFPRSGTAPSGVYSIEVDVFEVRDTADTWTLNVYGSNNVLEATYTGTGESVGLNYTFDESGRPDDDSCQVGVNNTQCCKDPDCTNTGLGDLCENRACIQKGNPRFTLSYFGDDSLDLIVITPDQEAIYSLNQFDNMSLGMYEPDLNNGTLGFHTQNIYFPRNGSSPNGEYLYFVDLVEQKGDSLDLWTLTFDDPGGNTERTITGAGTSEYFYFSKFPDVLSGQCKVQRDIECCEDNDCSGDEICSTFRCISDGTPRFTLSWLGDDDLDIFVKTPNGTRVDWKTPSDPESGLELEDDIDPESTIVHVENIYFSGSASGDRRLEESQAPVGDYTYGVELWDRRGEQRDEWNLTVSIGGVVVVSHTGRGSNSGFNFDFGVSVLPSMSTSPSSFPSSVSSTIPSNTEPSLEPSNTPSTKPSLSTGPSLFVSVTQLSTVSTVPSKNPSGKPSLSIPMPAFPSAFPSGEPSITSNPSHFPSLLPSRIPSSLPSTNPSIASSKFPFSLPSTSTKPSDTFPSSFPSMTPSVVPLVSLPSTSPSLPPSTVPSLTPSTSTVPSLNPSVIPSVTDSETPSALPSQSSSPSDTVPSSFPTDIPSIAPSIAVSSSIPSSQPSLNESTNPSTIPSGEPTLRPSATLYPSTLPSFLPSEASVAPSLQLSEIASNSPSSSDEPSLSPSVVPSVVSSESPSYVPSRSSSPSDTIPSSTPSTTPSVVPSVSLPSASPSLPPSTVPSLTPSSASSHFPTFQPSTTPSVRSSTSPSLWPSLSSRPSDNVPSSNPSVSPSSSSANPSSQPSAIESASPSIHPTSEPSSTPSTTRFPSLSPSLQPSSSSLEPSSGPSFFPSGMPSAAPFNGPSTVPPELPSLVPSSRPPSIPSSGPSTSPSSTRPDVPSFVPSERQLSPTLSSVPSTKPSNNPSVVPSDPPLTVPSGQPSLVPFNTAPILPTGLPTLDPSMPSQLPSSAPSSYVPSSQPSVLSSEVPSSSSEPPNGPSTVPSDSPTVPSPPSSAPSMNPTPLRLSSDWCFSGAMTVEVKGRGRTLMKDLVLGDSVLVGENQYEPIYSFGHRNHGGIGEYIRIHHSGETSVPIELSSTHMIYSVKNSTIEATPASTIKVGDSLLWETSGRGIVEVDVIRIEQISAQGLYAPFTLSGRIVVNRVLASSFIAFQDSPYLQIAGWTTPVSFQWIAHTFEAPHRLLCRQFGDATCFTLESYTSNGISNWVFHPFQFIQWLFCQHPLVQDFLLVLIVTLLGLIKAVELVLTTDYLFAALCLSLCVYGKVQQQLRRRKPKVD